MTKYSDLLAEWLVKLGYSHCFFVAGGNIMHLLESCSRRLTCIPVVHEVAAGIAAEYFNETHLAGKAFALVTAGPGLTNIVTALAGAYLESRELLVIGGQVKVADLARGQVRQRGIQEIDGVAIATPISERALRIESPINLATFVETIKSGLDGRPGPVFLEIPLDVQANTIDEAALDAPVSVFTPLLNEASDADLSSIFSRLSRSERPVILLGAGISRDTAEALLPQLSTLGIPVMVTWNAIDRISADHPLYFGRPNTWGMRYSNILLQQADLLIALGTRLSLQQTGFNWKQFLPVGEVIQVDIDSAELSKGHPAVALPVCADANAVLKAVCSAPRVDFSAWLVFCNEVKHRLPLVETVNHTGEGYLSPYIFAERLSDLTTAEDILIPASSGSAFTVMMQTFAQKSGQRIVTNKGLASMGYGLSGAIGAAFAGRGRRTILVEGDGGFIQNLQELGTVSANKLNIKIFIFNDNGYASIRMTQRNYFGGRYVGCDAQTGLGIPLWDHVFAAYAIPSMEIGPDFEEKEEFSLRFNASGASAFLVKIDPDQTYFPKITSRITKDGSMASNPLHLMSPDLPEGLQRRVFRFVRGQM